MSARAAVRLLVLALGAPAPGIGQPAGVTNAKPTMRSAAAGLAPVFAGLRAAQVRPAWIGYAVPVAGRARTCCHDCTERVGNSVGGCRLEGDGAFERRSDGGDDTTRSPVRLEASPELHVLFRVEGGRVERVRTFSAECALDAGGLPFHWITDVKPAESVALLSSLVPSASGDEGEEAGGTLAAIALHADPAADAALDRFAASGEPRGVRKQAAFWMGQTRGRHGYETLRHLVREDADSEFREHAVFALSQSHEPGAIDAILDVAKQDRSAHVRGQALFWLSQVAGRKAAGAISRAIEEDPETQVKEKAVFALSQLPPDEGVPLLIQQARTNRNPVVRKQAVFWLGQSGDARALAFFEEVLRR